MSARLYLNAQLLRFKTLKSYRGKSWRNIPIKECGEPLVLVPAQYCHPFYAKEMGLTDDQRIFLRETVSKKFLKANRIANHFGYKLIIYDGWRSTELQETLFWHYLKEFVVPEFKQLEDVFKNAVLAEEIKKVFMRLPDSTRTTLIEMNRTYVSWPSKNPKSPSPHATGGAIDVWLYRNNEPINLGVPFDWMDIEAGAFYHLKTKRKKFLGNDKRVCQHRNLMLYCMSKVGFSCYGPEIWHFNYGNQMHSLVTGKTAIYSYIEP